MTWIFLAVLLLCTCGLAASLFLAYSLKRQVWKEHGQAAGREAELRASVLGVQADFATLRARFEDLEHRTGMLVSPVPPLSGLNLTKRTQALRMLARGDQSDSIAAALNLPRAEAELLAKVKKLNG
jgi:hypothetical protein